MKNELVICVKNVRRSKHGKTVNEFARGLAVCSPHIIYKEQASAFGDGRLLALLRENNVSEIDVIGVDGCCCVARSAADAQALGFKATLPCAYIGAKSTERFEKKKALLKKQGVCII